MSKKVCFAILTVPISSKKKRFGPQEANFINIFNMATKKGMDVYIFTPGDVSWSERQIRGWVYQPNKKRWLQQVEEFPDVIYNRIPTRTKEKSSLVQETIYKFRKSYGIPLFNPFFLDKIEIQSILANNTKVREFIPEAIVKPNYPQLLAFLNKKKKVYLKPAQSSVGKGILVLERQDSGPITVRGIEGPSSSDKRVFTDETLKRLLGYKLAKGRYLAQEAIDLAQYQGRSFDIRILIQKDGWGTWQLTGMGARIAAEGHHTTHVPNGGESQSLQQVLKFVLPKLIVSSEEIIDGIRSASLVAAKAIEENYKTVFGEFSLDLALDKKGKIQILEVNSKPFVFDEKDVSQLARKRLLDFAQHLGGQKK